MVFHLSLSDTMFLHVSRTLLSILADHNNAVVWVVSTRPPISKSFCFLIVVERVTNENANTDIR